jgi:hypothetical protein
LLPHSDSTLALVKLTCCVNALCVVDGLNLLVENAEDDVDNNCSQVNPEKVLESLRGAEVEE